MSKLPGTLLFQPASLNDSIFSGQNCVCITVFARAFNFQVSFVGFVVCTSVSNRHV